MEEHNPYTATIEELWNRFNTIMNQQTDENTYLLDEHKKEYNTVKHGKWIITPIWYLTNETWHTIKPKNKTATILGYGTYTITDFMDEIEERKRIMINIIEQYEDTSIYEESN